MAARPDPAVVSDDTVGAQPASASTRPGCGRLHRRRVVDLRSGEERRPVIPVRRGALEDDPGHSFRAHEYILGDAESGDEVLRIRNREYAPEHWRVAPSAVLENSADPAAAAARPELISDAAKVMSGFSVDAA